MSSAPVFDVNHLATLARLELTSAERERFAHQLPAILAYVSQLQTLDLAGVEEAAHVTGLENVFRDDTYSADLTDADRHQQRDELLAAAPALQDHFVKVPAILADSTQIEPAAGKDGQHD